MSITTAFTHVVKTRRGHVRALANRRIGGYLIYWSDPSTKDSYDTYFPPDVDLMEDVYTFMPPVYYEHAGAVGLPTRKAYVGDVVDMRKDNTGLWVEAELHDSLYADALYEDVQKGVLFWSSGTADHLLDIAPDGRVVTWPIFDATLTENPATPFGTDVVALRQHYAAHGFTTAVRAIDEQWLGNPQSDEQPTDTHNSIAEVNPMGIQIKLPNKAYFNFIRSLADSPAAKHEDIRYALKAIRAYGVEDTAEQRADGELMIADKVVDNERMARGLSGAAQILAETFGIELVEAEEVMQRITSALALEGYIAGDMSEDDGMMSERAEMVEEEEVRADGEEEEDMRAGQTAIAPAAGNGRSKPQRSAAVWQPQGNGTSRLTAQRARFDNGQRRAPELMQRSGVVDSLAKLMYLKNIGKHSVIEKHNDAVRAHYAALEAKIRREQGYDFPIRTQAINPSTSGGFLVAPEFATQVIEFRYDASVIAPLVRKYPTTAYELLIPKQTSGSSAYHIGENTTIPSSGISLGQVRLRARKLATIIENSNELLADAFVNIDELLARNIAEDFAETIDRMILFGSGVSEEPLGIYNTSGVTIRTETAVSYEELLQVRQRLQINKTRSSDRWRWVMNPIAETELRTLQDPNGNYIFVGNNPSYVQSAEGAMPERLLGSPVSMTNQATNPQATTEGMLFYGFWDSIFYMEHQAMEIAYSTEAGDLYYKDQNAVRAIMRYDVAMAYDTDIQVIDGIA